MIIVMGLFLPYRKEMGECLCLGKCFDFSVTAEMPRFSIPSFVLISCRKHTWSLTF